jgi:hypothetical protein
VSNCLRVVIYYGGKNSLQRPYAGLVTKGTLLGKSRRRVLARPSINYESLRKIIVESPNSILDLKPSETVTRAW